MDILHCTATGGSGMWWRYDSVRKTIWLCLSRSSCAVEVCSQKEPRYGAFPIVRVDETTWKILPVRYIGRDRSGELTSVTAPIAEALGLDSVNLIGATEKVAASLAELE
jgi:hypothetical protein